MRLAESILDLSPSDLVNHLGCTHLTELNRKVALGERKEPDWNNPAVKILHQKGIEHESEYLQHLQKKGLKIIDLTDKGYDSTIMAMKEGYDVIYQARLRLDEWSGVADFLIRTPGESMLGDYHYEIEDTKLSQETKAGSLLQLCVYAEMVTSIQGRKPTKLYVVKPGEDFPKDQFNLVEYESYYNLVKRQFLTYIKESPHDTYPEPVVRCEICKYWKECNDRWHKDDHLSLIAGIQTMHRKELEKQGVNTLENYAELPAPYKTPPEQGSKFAYEKIHNQSKIQLKGRRKGDVLYELLELVENRGLNRLPEPSLGDIYFDIESDHFYEEGGLNYLLGYTYKDEKGESIYKRIWSKDKLEEKKSFEDFMDLIMDRWARYADFHIYHFAPFEPAAIKRMAQYHRTKEVEVDKLLRGQRFIDILSITKESLRASVESYSLKNLEQLTSFERKTDLQLASLARRRTAMALEIGNEKWILLEDIELIEDYNKEDCLATYALHNFLESLYQENKKKLQRPPLLDGSAKDYIEERDIEADMMFKELTKDLPEDRGIWNDENKVLWLAAHLVEYYRREKKSAFWEYFRLQDMELEELETERKAIVGLTLKGIHQDSKRVPIHIYSFGPQEVSMKPGRDVFEIGGDTVGSIYEISADDNLVSIKKTGKTKDIHPTSICTKEIPRDGILVKSLWKILQYIIAKGINGGGHFRAARDLLLRKEPSLLNGERMEPNKGESLEEHALRVLLNLNNSTLPIQGPPGTGKTFNGSKLIVELMQRGKKVGITAVSHSVIINFLEEVEKAAIKKGHSVDIKHKVSSNTVIEAGDDFNFKKTEDTVAFLDSEAVVGGTAWLWADDRLEDQLDYLFVDEAGQMSLANVLAVSKATKNLVLLGDPQQLEQPQKGAHPEGADVSALQHVLGEDPTIPSEKGIFLDTTYRLPPSIASFTSSLYYENRLKSFEDTKRQEILGDSDFSGSGLIFYPVSHTGNQSSSIEEAEAIEKIVNELLNSKLQWIDRNGNISSVLEKDILIVAPYNAQVAEIKNRLKNISVGTVDKFQGKQAPIVVYSMTSSSPEYAPRGMSFLYDPHRLNVATSRAQCICILVASPKIMEPECRTIDQMNWANGLCKYVEMARVIN